MVWEMEKIWGMHHLYTCQGWGLGVGNAYIIDKFWNLDTKRSIPETRSDFRWHVPIDNKTRKEFS